MKQSIGLLFISALAASLMAGCNNSNNNNNGFGSNCGTPPNGFQILYPRNSAGRIPPNNANAVYVAANPALASGNSYNFFVVQSNGNQQFTSTFATYSGPIPSPHNTPTSGSTVYVTYMPNPIGPLQTVNLYWNDGGTGCTPNAIVSSYTTTQ
ncbi:MAG: hypothetical protein JOZ01_09030 [Candidatus Eremiobacteraeota bacterium]|nr:hypothetical protein [Candidatus Eremiobacteraeota bacterium]